MYEGRVSMFEKAGFKIVAPYASGRTSTVVMRRTIQLDIYFDIFDFLIRDFGGCEVCILAMRSPS